MTVLREILSRLAFPLIMGLGIGITYWFIHVEGYAINTITFPVVIISLITIACLERIIPFRSSWNKNVLQAFKISHSKLSLLYDS